MKEPKEITISIDHRFFTIEMGVEEEELIESFFGALKNYVKKGSPIKLKQAYLDSDSLSQEMKIISKTITQSKQIDTIRTEAKRVTAVKRKR